jgi:hypothetical protein
MNPSRKYLHNFRKPPTNSTHQSTISKELNPKKSSGYDLITGNILKELPIIGIKCLILNAVWHNGKSQRSSSWSQENLLTS